MRRLIMSSHQDLHYFHGYLVWSDGLKWLTLKALSKIVAEDTVKCFFDLGLTSLSTIFQSYRDGVWV